MARELTLVCQRGDMRPGQMRYFDIDGLPVALTRVGDQFYAFSDTCRHQGGPLSSGVLIDETVTCPWHGWTYSIRTGKAIVPPVGIRIPVYDVVLEGDSVYVAVDWPDT